MIRYLLDTNVISEITKPEPAVRLTTWLRSVDSRDTFLSVITVGEVQEGLERMPLSAKRNRLYRWFDQLLAEYDERILPIDRSIARAWGVARAKSLANGKPLPIADGYIAATTKIHGLTLVTRNVRDYSTTDIAIINPFSS